MSPIITVVLALGIGMVAYAVFIVFLPVGSGAKPKKKSGPDARDPMSEFKEKRIARLEE